MLWIGRDFQRLQAQRRQQRKQKEVGRRLQPDAVTGLRHGTQRQLQRLHAAVGQGDLIGGQRLSGVHRPPRGLLP